MRQQQIRPTSSTGVSWRSVRQVVPPSARGSRRHLQCYNARDVTVVFKVNKKISYGEAHKLVGGHPSLGNWNAEAAPAMSWTQGDVWQYEVKLPAGQEVEFKVIRQAHEVEWETGNNRRFKVPDADRVEVVLKWGKTDRTLASDGVAAAASSAPKQEAPQQQGQEAAAASNGSKPNVATMSSSYDEAGSEAKAGAAGWQGKDIVFMRSNQHSKERGGNWDKQGLEGPMLAIVEGDEQAPSWLKKLEVAKRVLVDESNSNKPTEKGAVAGYVYLQWISTGAIECAEGGGHYRPNHHAELAKKIFRSLEWASGEQETSYGRMLMLRKLHTKIPSFSEAFTASVPLTRIRDIAHRNDIPHDLKAEIKHTLQNKLHRNAGPEDLMATEQMLLRITKNPGEYNEAFVNEFKVFYAELCDFFNASSLSDLLNAMKPSMAEDRVVILDKFLDDKAKLDARGPDFPADLQAFVTTLHSLTTVRALLCNGLSSGLRNDASDAAMAMRQRWRLAEVKCEEYAFVLLSRAINWMEDRGGANFLNGASDPHWALPIGAVVLGIRNVGLGGFESAECVAVEAELAAWQSQGTFQMRETALRLKATLDRLNRMGDRYSTITIDLLEPAAKKLGKALGIQEHAIRTFAEAEIRASIMLQLSKLCNMLTKSTRLVGGVGPWDTIVAGTTAGKLIKVDRLSPAALKGVTEDVILLVEAADGDEEVAVLGSNLKGVILCQELPHLSHLGVRARQDNVVFTTCDDSGYMREKVLPLLGQHVLLATSAENVSLMPSSRSVDFPNGMSGKVVAVPSSNGVTFKPTGLNGVNGSSKDAAAPAAAAVVGGAPKAGEIRKVLVERLIPMSQVMPHTGGAKAMGCFTLNGVAEQTANRDSSFLTPAGCVVPFGVMDIVIAKAGQLKEYERLMALVETAEDEELEAAAGQLRTLISGLRPSGALLEEVKKELAKNMANPEAQVIVRSSSNVEDLAGLSGAGLYDSIPGIDYTNPESLGPAIAEVWASLYTRRAILSRRAAGVSQKSASMAILVQELILPELSFVLHTTSPIDHNPQILYAEVAVGHGETLASGMRGSPWRWLVDKSTMKLVAMAFANFSEAMLPGPANQPPLRWTSGGAVAATRPSLELTKRVVDYSQQELSTSTEKRKALGKKLCQIGKILEEKFRGPQDVEGCVVGNQVFIVQTRPQP